RGAVQRLNNAARVGQVQAAVVNQRRRLIRSRVVHRPRPHQLKLLNVLPVDLIERAVAPGVICAPPVQPVAWSRIAQYRLGDRTEVLHLRHEPETSQQHHAGNAKGQSDSHRAPPSGMDSWRDYKPRMTRISRI